MNLENVNWKQVLGIAAIVILLIGGWLSPGEILFPSQSDDVAVIDVGTRGGITNFDTLTLSEDLNVVDDMTVTDDASIGGDLSVTGATTLTVQNENIGALSVITASVPYTPATGALWTIADGEVWYVYDVFIETTTNFDCTGNDCTLVIGDGNDPNGFISAADANIQTTFTEATGYAAGYFGIENGSNGAYTIDDGGPFIYAPSGSAETIDYTVGGTDPAAGAATATIVYMRVQ